MKSTPQNWIIPWASPTQRCLGPWPRWWNRQASTHRGDPHGYFNLGDHGIWWNRLGYVCIYILYMIYIYILYVIYIYTLIIYIDYIHWLNYVLYWCIMIWPSGNQTWLRNPRQLGWWRLIHSWENHIEPWPVNFPLWDAQRYRVPVSGRHGYPLVNIQKSYWKWWFIVDLPINNGDFP